MRSLSSVRFASLRTASVLSVAATLGTFVSAPQSAHAQTSISTLFNTGVDASNTLLAGGSADPHYTMIANNVGLTNGTNAFVLNSPSGSYPQNPTSKYISPDGNDGTSVNVGNYALTYRTTFTLPANVILSSVSIVGAWATDNIGTDILVNGSSTGFTSPGFNPFNTFTLPTTFYKTGINTLDYVWANQGGPGGVNVYYTTKTYNVSASAAPEPGSIALAGACFLPLAGYAVRRRRFGANVNTGAAA